MMKNARLLSRFLCAGLLNRTLVFFVLGVFAGSSLALVSTSNHIEPLKPLPKYQKSTCYINVLMRQLHYKNKALNDELSAKIFERYLESLDPNRSIFHAGDIKEFQHYRYKLDDALLNYDLAPAFTIYNRFRRRVAQRVSYALGLLNRKFDFNVDEKYQYNRSKADWARDTRALDRLWYKRVKNDYLNLRLAGKKDKDIVTTLRKRYERLGRRNSQSKPEDVYQLFMNAYTLSIEPHTSYLSPRTSEDFKIHMSLSLEGIGAALGTEHEYTIIRKIIPGGPAQLSRKLGKGDRIVGVAQGNKKMVDVVGWRLDDVVRLIRGKKGTVVRLAVLKKGVGHDGPRKIITLVRNKIKLQDQAAKKSIIEIGKGPNKVRIGVITLPTFYLDFDARARGERDYQSTTRDVRRILREFKREKVDGVLMDLRGNGGGSLSEATALTGLFIRTGPIVQIRYASGSVKIERDNDPRVEYEGPLAVLVDKGSASASEIFAGAIQDYKRGIIIGDSTFGKGTVQSLIDVKFSAMYSSSGRRTAQYIRDISQCNAYSTGMKRLGQLKLTIAQFFRINGESTQHRGVVPDIKMPSVFDMHDQGESSLKNALPWARIPPTRYYESHISEVGLARARAKHRQRIRSEEGFKYFRLLAKTLKKIKKQTTVTLLESKRRIERKRREEERLRNENKLRIALGMKPLSKEDDKKEKDEADDSNNDPAQKILLQEAVRVLADYIVLSNPNAEAIVDRTRNRELPN